MQTLNEQINYLPSSKSNGIFYFYSEDIDNGYNNSNCY